MDLDFEFMQINENSLNCRCCGGPFVVSSWVRISDGIISFDFAYCLDHAKSLFSWEQSTKFQSQYDIWLVTVSKTTFPGILCLYCWESGIHKADYILYSVFCSLIPHCLEFHFVVVIYSKLFMAYPDRHPLQKTKTTVHIRIERQRRLRCKTRRQNEKYESKEIFLSWFTWHLRSQVRPDYCILFQREVKTFLIHQESSRYGRLDLQKKEDRFRLQASFSESREGGIK
jgi:hypothetical protein